ncbi:MAG: FAD-binding oxidoreductase [Deltaproteobacteria bacterium]|nr:MAG: FAD-binding oxidoreductase [Deltaproteobacteria bacterium]
MKGRAELEALRAALGARAVRAHTPIEVDGVALGVTVAPADADSLSAALQALSQRRLAAVVRGGGTRLGFGNPPRRADVLLSTERLTGIDVLDAEDGVAQVWAGTPVAALREATRARGWELALDPPGEGSTLGGTLASAATGPRSLGFGPPRDSVLGLSVVLASGTRTRCGGRVVKNVTGYDLAKLYTGSFGTLGVISRAWLRLRPRPERELVLRAPARGLAKTLERGVAWARRPGVRALAIVDAELAARVDPGSRGAEEGLVLIELAGDAPVVERDAERLARELRAEATSERALERVREVQGSTPRPSGMRVRVSALASRLAAALEPLARVGAQLLVYPGQGLVYGFVPLASANDAAAARAALRESARAGDGTGCIEDAPSWAKHGDDVFGASGPELALMRSIKRRFDPEGVLNPGRFAGGL